MASAAFDVLKAKYQYVFDFLSASENVKSEKLKLNFEKFLKNHIVLGFNSESYDLNLIKKQLIRVLLPKLDFVIKRNNHFMCIKTETLRFLDIKNYIAPGFHTTNLSKHTMSVKLNFSSPTSMWIVLKS